jgi:hypothetical protein
MTEKKIRILSSEALRSANSEAQRESSAFKKAIADFSTKVLHRGESAAPTSKGTHGTGPKLARRG